MPQTVRFPRHAMHDFSRDYIAQKRQRVHAASMAGFSESFGESQSGQDRADL